MRAKKCGRSELLAWVNSITQSDYPKIEYFSDANINNYDDVKNYTRLYNICIIFTVLINEMIDISITNKLLLYSNF